MGTHSSKEATMKQEGYWEYMLRKTREANEADTPDKPTIKKTKGE